MQDVNDKAKPIFSSGNNDTSKLVQNRELGHIIENALAKISEDYRMVFSLREVIGLTVSETADLLQLSPGNVKVRLNRAKKMLRNEIEKSYAPEELFEFNLIYCDVMVENVMKRINEL